MSGLEAQAVNEEDTKSSVINERFSVYYSDMEKTVELYNDYGKPTPWPGLRVSQLTMRMSRDQAMDFCKIIAAMAGLKVKEEPALLHSGIRIHFQKP